MPAPPLRGAIIPGWRSPAALAARCPEASDCLERLVERVYTDFDPAVLELVRLRLAQLLGHQTGLQVRSAAAREAGLSDDKAGAVAAYATSAHFSVFEAQALEFAEQLCIDVSGTTEENLAALASEVGTDQLRNFVTAIFVVEFTQRLEMMARALLPAEPDRAAAARADDRPATVRALLDDFQAAVMRGTTLDPTITELVRLRCARAHHCRICQTLRLDDARAAGVDDTMTSKIDFYEQSDLPERAKVALRITDAFIIAPNDLTAPTIERARALFSADQLSELCLDIVKWSTQKVHVALGLDGTDALATKDGIALFGFDSQGSVAGYWTD